MKKFELTVLISCLIISGCNASKKLVAKVLFNVGPPKVESNESILKSALRYNLDTSKLLCFNDIGDYMNIITYSNNPDEVIIFDASLRHLRFISDSGRCSGGTIYNVIDSLAAGRYLNFPTTYNSSKQLISLDKNEILYSQTHWASDSTIFSFNSLHYINNGKSFSFDKSKRYHVFLPCAKFFGNLNKSFIKELQDKLAQSSRENFEYYLISMDFNNKWTNGNVLLK